MRGREEVCRPHGWAPPHAGQLARRLVVGLLVATAAAAAPATALASVDDLLRGLGGRLRRGTVTDAGLETVVVEVASLALVLGSCWVLLLVLAGLTEALTGSAPALLRSLSPVVVRRTAALACGAALGTTAVMAPATALHGDTPTGVSGTGHLGGTTGHGTRVTVLTPPRRPSALPLTGLVLPERATGSAGAASVTVRHGDSLWSLAEDLLPHAGNEEIDRAWRALYAANRPTLGHDPDVVHPGTSLRIPGELSERREVWPERPRSHRRSPEPHSPDEHQQPREEAP